MVAVGTTSGLARVLDVASAWVGWLPVGGILIVNGPTFEGGLGG